MYLVHHKQEQKLFIEQTDDHKEIRRLQMIQAA